jgi:DNA-binding MarR family transcriptional regulator
VKASPEADAESVRSHLAFVRAFEVLSAGSPRPRPNALPTPLYTLVRILYFADEYHLTQIEIGRQMGVTSTYITRLVDDLEGRGLVRRVVNAADRRKTYVQLTPFGRETCDELVPNTIRFMENSLRLFNAEEKKNFQYLLSKFTLGMIEARAESVQRQRRQGGVVEGTTPHPHVFT